MDNGQWTVQTLARLKVSRYGNILGGLSVVMIVKCGLSQYFGNVEIVLFLFENLPHFAVEATKFSKHHRASNWIISC